jgi:hypothetical protein
MIPRRRSATECLQDEGTEGQENVLLMAYVQAKETGNMNVVTSVAIKEMRMRKVTDQEMIRPSALYSSVLATSSVT